MFAPVLLAFFWIPKLRQIKLISRKVAYILPACVSLSNEAEIPCVCMSLGPQLGSRKTNAGSNREINVNNIRESGPGAAFTEHGKFFNEGLRHLPYRTNNANNRQTFVSQ